MTLLKPISNLVVQAVNDGTFSLRQSYELAARMVDAAAQRQADALKKDWAALYEAPVDDQTALSDEIWYKLRQMGESYWEVRSAGVTSLNGDSFGLKNAFYSYVSNVFEAAVTASGDPAREVYGLTNKLVDVLKFMDMNDNTLARFCDLVERLDPHAKDPKNAALQKMVTYQLQYRSMAAPQHLLGTALAYRIQEAKGLALPDIHHRQPKPQAGELMPNWMLRL